MGSRFYVALVLSLNLLSLSMVRSQNDPCNPLDVRACLSVLGLVQVTVPPNSSSLCCTALQGLGAKATFCLCTALRANTLGLNINIPVAINATITTCGLTNPGSDPRCQ